VAPYDATLVQKNNFLNVQVDAIGVGLANAASPFLPVFLTRLGATNLQIGLLTAMPGVAGLFLAIFVGRFLQNRRKIVPWFSMSRLLYLSAFTATGIAPFLVPEDQLIFTILMIWAVATLPQTALSVSFSVVMNAVAGPAHRYDLMARRWSILGVTTALTVAAAGQFLGWFEFSLNYQLLFILLSLGGLVSFIFSRRIELPDSEPIHSPPGLSLRQRTHNYFSLVWSHKDFVNFSAKRVVYLFGTLLATPLFPLYYVRVVQAPDAWIGYINTAQTIVLLIGYSLWTRQSRRRGSRFVLLTATLGLSIYPALVANTQNLTVIVIIAGLAGIFQAGIDLVFFDELMKTVPVEYSATFVSLAQSMTYASSVLAPLAGTWLSGQIGIAGGLMVASGVRFLGFLLFAFWNPKPTPEIVANS
jgi:MFS family permease